MTIESRGTRLEDLKDAYIKVKNRVPQAVGVTARNFFKQSFRRQGWLDETLQPWPPRQGGAPREQGRNLLIDSGQLRKSIRLIEARKGRVVVGSDVPYARIHNEGGRIQQSVNVRAHERRAHTRRINGKRQRVRAHKVQAHTRQMDVRIPQRQFMGNSASLNREINNTIERMVNRELKKL